MLLQSFMTWALMITLLHKPYLIKVTVKGGGRDVQNKQKTVHVVYRWSPTPFLSFMKNQHLKNTKGVVNLLFWFTQNPLLSKFFAHLLAKNSLTLKYQYKQSRNLNNKELAKLQIRSLLSSRKFRQYLIKQQLLHFFYKNTANEKIGKLKKVESIGILRGVCFAIKN